MSAAVWGIYSDKWQWRTSEGLAELAQDPREWAKEGLVDVVVPMTYLPMTPTYCGRADWACLLDDHLAGVQEASGKYVYIGIGGDKGLAEAPRQIALARSHGAHGIAIFSYSSAEAAGLFDTLASDVFASTATVPTMSWLSAEGGSQRLEPSRPATSETSERHCTVFAKRCGAQH
jgi:uncharacterized lipoprotein YddW (UPF0748 family)